MSLGTQKALDANAAKQPDHPAPQAQPKWDVSHREVLNQIKHDRAPVHPEVRPTVVQAHQPQREPHREIPHPQPQQQNYHRPALPGLVSQANAAPRNDASHPVPPVNQNTRPQWNPSHTRPEVVAHPPQVVQNPAAVGNQQIAQQYRGNQNQHPIEVNRTIINNNQRYEYGNSGQHNNTNNSLKYLYGGLAGGALLGGAGTYYANRDYGYGYNNTDSYRNWNTYNQYNQYNNFDQWSLNNTYNRYGLNQYDQYAWNQSDQYRYPNAIYESTYADSYDPLLNGTYGNSDYLYGSTYNNNDYLYGGTTYGATRFDDGYNSPIYETTIADSYRPVYRDANPADAIPRLFSNLIGGVLGTITRSQHHRQYYDRFDC